jgi:hypothetical protein
MSNSKARNEQKNSGSTYAEPLFFLFISYQPFLSESSASGVPLSGETTKYSIREK